MNTIEINQFFSIVFILLILCKTLLLVFRHARHPPSQDRPRAVLRRQRPAVGVLLPQRLRLRRGRLRRPGNEGEARGRLRPAAGRHHLRADLAAVRRSTPRVQRLITHGDGVMDIALEVDDVRAAFDEAVERGADGDAPAGRRWKTSTASTRRPRIRAYGDTTHTFVNRDRYRGVFAPGYQPIDPDRYQPEHRSTRSACAAIDHIVGNVEEGQDERVGRVLPQGARLQATRLASTTRTSAPSTRP